MKMLKEHAYHQTLKSHPIQPLRDEWMDSYVGHREFVEQHGIVAGSFALWAGLYERYQGWKPGDIDVFTRTSEDFQALLTYFGEIGTRTGGLDNTKNGHVYSIKGTSVRWQILPPPPPGYVTTHPPASWHFMGGAEVWNTEMFYESREIAGIFFVSGFDLSVSQHFIHENEVKSWLVPTLTEKSPEHSLWINLSNLVNPIRTLQRVMKYERRGFSIATAHLNALLKEIRSLDDAEFLELGYAAGIVRDSEMPWYMWDGEDDYDPHFDDMD